jgi:hypothetical protein
MHEGGTLSDMDFQINFASTLSRKTPSADRSVVMIRGQRVVPRGIDANKHRLVLHSVCHDEVDETASQRRGSVVSSMVYTSCGLNQTPCSYRKVGLCSRRACEI